MDQACDEALKGALLELLKPLKGFLAALDRDDRIVGLLPDRDALPGRGRAELVGQALGKALRADFVRVFDGKDGWDEIGYFHDGRGERTPYQVHRFKPAPTEDAAGAAPSLGAGFASLFPEAAAFLLAAPLPAYDSLENAHKSTLASHARELEAMNQKLTRRTRRLKKAMDVLEARNRQIVKEMNLAVELQKSLLPKAYPETELVSFTHRYIPLAMVGGDFFDIVSLPDERIGVLISDVSGHGIAPAFITAMIRSSFDYLAPYESSPAKVIRRLNQEFAKIIDTDHVVSAFYAILDLKLMRCLYCNAGHPAQIIARADGGFVELGPGNPIIGMMDDFDFADEEIELGYGDSLCFYTDGIVEARDGAGRFFGVEGICRSMAAAAGDEVEGMADRLITDLIEFMKDPYFEDDVTVLFARIIDSL
jgi:serine phosphatase RsbU (regulator of sigma subunit)